VGVSCQSLSDFAKLTHIAHIYKMVQH
jgi:hypothetical protein